MVWSLLSLLSWQLIQHYDFQELSQVDFAAISFCHICFFPSSPSFIVAASCCIALLPFPLYYVAFLLVTACQQILSQIFLAFSET